MKTGINFIIPFPKTTTTIAVTSAESAIHQLPVAMSIATGANDKPINIITGPTTAEGNNFSITYSTFIEEGFSYEIRVTSASTDDLQILQMQLTIKE